MDRLLRMEEAAERLGVPVASLRTVADTHGKTIRMGRAVRLHPDDIEELVSLCRVEPKDRAYTGASAKTGRPSGKSETQASSQSRPARTAATMLKNNSQNTLPGKTAQVAPFPRKN